MPELPEVELVAAELRAVLTGRKLRRLRHAHADVLSYGPGLDAAALSGREFTGAGRRGKMLLLQLSPSELVLTVHLRMTGRLAVEPADSDPPVHCHVILELDGDEELRFTDARRFGRMQLLERAQLAEDSFLRRLGPEPGELELHTLRERLARRHGSLKGALLDQSLVAGLGNIYVDEILHRAGLHPALPASALRSEESARLHESIDVVIAAAIEAGGSTIRDYRKPSGEFGSYQLAHQVFGRAGQACPRCGADVVKIVVVGRGTHLCPDCQPKRRRKARRTRQVIGK